MELNTREGTLALQACNFSKFFLQMSEKQRCYIASNFFWLMTTYIYIYSWLILFRCATVVGGIRGKTV